MRPDVKLGMAISLVIILVAGGYYLYRDSREQPVPLSNDRFVTATPGGKNAPMRAAAKKAVAQGKRSGRKSTGTNSATKKLSGKRTRRAADGASTSPVSTELGKKISAKRGSGATGASTAQPTGTVSKSLATSKQGRRNSKSEPSSVRRGSAGAKGRARGALPPNVREQVAGTNVDNTVKRANPSSSGRSSRSTNRTLAKMADSATSPPRRVKSSASTQGRVARAADGRAGVNRWEAAVDTHRVQSGDTFASLALAYYGNEKHTRFLINSNPQVRDPRRLQIGAVLKVPPLSGVAEAASERRASARSSRDVRRADHQTYRVEPGDSFYAIARTVLGDADRWGELYALNKTQVGSDPAKLKVGQVLMLPE